MKWALQYQQGLVVLELVVVVVVLVYFDQPVWDLEQESALQVPEPDFVLQDFAFNLWDLELHPQVDLEHLD